MLGFCDGAEPTSAPIGRLTLDGELRLGLRRAISNRRRELVPYTGNNTSAGHRYEWHETALRMQLRGAAPQEIADACGVGRQAVYSWLRQYRPSERVMGNVEVRS